MTDPTDAWGPSDSEIAGQYAEQQQELQERSDEFDKDIDEIERDVTKHTQTHLQSFLQRIEDYEDYLQKKLQTADPQLKAIIQSFINNLSAVSDQLFTIAKKAQITLETRVKADGLKHQIETKSQLSDIKSRVEGGKDLESQKPEGKE